MQACRQIYRETEPLLWNFNIFSFGDGKSLDRFVANTINATEVSRLANIRIHIKYVPEDLVLWPKVLRSSLLDKLTRLEVLHLCLDRDIARPSQGYGRGLAFHGPILEARDRLISPMNRLSLLPMKHATFLIKDNGKGHWEWTDQQKQALAQDVLHCLMDPPATVLKIARRDARGAEHIYQTIEDIKTSRRPQWRLQAGFNKSHRGFKLIGQNKPLTVKLGYLVLRNTPLYHNMDIQLSREDNKHVHRANLDIWKVLSCSIL